MRGGEVEEEGTERLWCLSQRWEWGRGSGLGLGLRFGLWSGSGLRLGGWPVRVGPRASLPKQGLRRWRTAVGSVRGRGGCQQQGGGAEARARTEGEHRAGQTEDCVRYRGRMWDACWLHVGCMPLHLRDAL